MVALVGIGLLWQGAVAVQWWQQLHLHRQPNGRGTPPTGRDRTGAQGIAYGRKQGAREETVPLVVLPGKTPTESRQECNLRERLSNCTLDHLAGRVERLKKYLRRQRLPRLIHFTAFGTTQVNLQAHAADISPVSKELQQCLSGFLDREARGSDEALGMLVQDAVSLRDWVNTENRGINITGGAARPSLERLKNLLD